MLLLESELKGTYYKQAVNVDANDLATYLARANAFAIGVIGGVPSKVDATIKTAVAMAFEIFTLGETAQVDDETGNITEAAPTIPYYRRKERDPLDVVREMLQPAKRIFELENTQTTERSVKFL